MRSQHLKYSHKGIFFQTCDDSLNMIRFVSINLAITARDDETDSLQRFVWLDVEHLLPRLR
ncbi:hypothetical protein Plhal703r1_c46g0148551 [Plasmopara halstedii]